MEERKMKESTASSTGSAVWVYAQRRERGIHPVVLEVLGAGRKLAEELSCPLAAVLAGGMREREHTEKMAKELIAYGADQVYLTENDLLETYSTDGYVKAVVQLAEEERPSILLFAGTDEGRDLAPRAAARLKTGLTVDCTELKIEDGKLCQIRPAFGSRLMAEIVTKGEGPSMCTVRPGMFRPAEKNEERAGGKDGPAGRLICRKIAIERSEIRTKVISSRREEKEADGLLEARAVVAGGMGIGRAEGFELLEQLASEFDGAVGGTRPAAAEGWISHDKMIGQTGRIITPD